MKTYSLFWSNDAEESLNEIIEYIVGNSGIEMAEKIFNRLKKRVNTLKVNPLQGKIVQELKDVGIRQIHELVESPWRIFYKVGERKVYILCILDGRRDIQEILISKVIDGKII
jgi:plasmid stabilization system protein ParE